MGAARSELLRIGVLAVQGGFEAHVAVLRSLGAEAVEVRSAEQIDQLDGLVIPGGESTTISMGIARDGLEEAIRHHHSQGRPVLGTCAGMIVSDRAHLGLADAEARRNAFGRQRQSFEAEIEMEGVGPEPLRAVFIRAPWVSDHGPDVEVLASWEGHPVAIRDGHVLLCAFHPELTDDSRVHALFMAAVTEARERRARAGAGAAR